MRRFTVYLVGHRQVEVLAESVDAAEALALTEAETLSGLGWLVADTEEN